MRPAQKALLQTLLPAIGFEPGPEHQTLDFSVLLPGRTRFAFEIGFGGGEHLIAQARTHSDWGFLGAEPFINGIAKTVAAIRTHALGNVRIHAGDGRDVAERLAPGCLTFAYVLFPDPWPKLRHQKRRILQAPALPALVKALSKGGHFRFASDDAAYVAWARGQFAQCADLALVRDASSKNRPDAEDWPQTRYERKALAAGRPCTFLEYVKR